MLNSVGSIGIFGSSFDPIHFGHLRVVEKVQSAMAFDQIRMVLTSRPAHKAPSVVSDDHRWEMLCLACKNKEDLIPEDFEKNQSGISFSINTLHHLKQKFAGARLSWIMGADAFFGLSSWYRWEELFELCNFVIVDRPNSQEKPSKQFKRFYQEKLVGEIDYARNGQIYHLGAPMIGVSSTEIRQNISKGLSITEFLPECVANYVLENKLYL